MPREIIIISDDDPFGRLDVYREPAPSAELAEWAGTGPARGEWEAANDVAVEYLAPEGRSA